MVPVQKSNGKLRICVDLRKLNNAAKRARFVLPTLEDIALKLAGAQYFCLMQRLDSAKYPYIQIVLSWPLLSLQWGDSVLNGYHLESRVPQKFPSV